jgi:hypothetical protein
VNRQPPEQSAALIKEHLLAVATSKGEAL